MGGIIQVDTIQNNNTSTLIAQTNTTTITIARSGQTVVIPSGTTFNASSASVNLPAISLTTGVTGTLPIANGGTNLTTYTAGNLLYASNSTTLTTLPIGTSTQVLGVSSGVPAWTSVSSDYVLLATATASSSATVSFDGYFSSTYTNYVLICTTVLNATSTAIPNVRFRRSNADVTASNYIYQYSGSFINSTGSDFDRLAVFNASSFALTKGNKTSAALYAPTTVIEIFDPLNTTAYKQISAKTNFWNDSVGAGAWFMYYGYGILTDNANALSGITFYMSSGNITSGTFKLYGIK
jgi:hypothetical protein